MDQNGHGDGSDELIIQDGFSMRMKFMLRILYRLCALQHQVTLNRNMHDRCFN